MSSVQVFARVKPVPPARGPGLGGGRPAAAPTSKAAAAAAARSGAYTSLRLDEGAPPPSGDYGGGAGLPTTVCFDGEGPGVAPRSFTVDGGFAPESTQVDVWDTVGKPLVASVLAGYNATVLAYGHTGSGKTHTILGPTDTRSGGGAWSFTELDGGREPAGFRPAGAPPSHPATGAASSLGLLPRAAHALLCEIASSARADADASAAGGGGVPRCYSLAFACVEVYRNSLLDLCAGAAEEVPGAAPVTGSGITQAAPKAAAAAGGAAAAAAGAGGGVLVGGTGASRVGAPGLDALTWVPVPLYDSSGVLHAAAGEGGGGAAAHHGGGGASTGSRVAASPAAAVLHRLIARANTLRVTAATSANRDSSRSHVLYLLRLGSLDPLDGLRREAVLSVVDLAGSENLDTTNAGSSTSAARGAETKAINSSLHVLKRVVEAHAAAPPGQPPAHVPWRESLLTSLLRDSIGGNCRTAIMITLAGDSPEAVGHSMRACAFGKLARAVRNKAVVNTSFDEGGLVEVLRAQIRDLSERLRGTEGQLVEALSAKVAGGGGGANPLASPRRVSMALRSLGGGRPSMSGTGSVGGKQGLTLSELMALVAPPPPAAGAASDGDALVDTAAAGVALNDWLAVTTAGLSDDEFEGVMRQLAGVAAAAREAVLATGLQPPELDGWGARDGGGDDGTAALPTVDDGDDEEDGDDDGGENGDDVDGVLRMASSRENAPPAGRKGGLQSLLKAAGKALAMGGAAATPHRAAAAGASSPVVVGAAAAGSGMGVLRTSAKQGRAGGGALAGGASPSGGGGGVKWPASPSGSTAEMGVGVTPERAARVDAMVAATARLAGRATSRSLGSSTGRRSTGVGGDGGGFASLLRRGGSLRRPVPSPATDDDGWRVHNQQTGFVAAFAAARAASAAAASLADAAEAQAAAVRGVASALAASATAASSASAAAAATDAAALTSALAARREVLGALAERLASPVAVAGLQQQSAAAGGDAAAATVSAFAPPLGGHTSAAPAKGKPHLPLPLSSVHAWQWQDEAGGWHYFSADDGNAVTDAVNASHAPPTEVAVPGEPTPGVPSVAVLGATADGAPAVVPRADAPVPPPTAALDAVARRVLGLAGGVASAAGGAGPLPPLALPCGTDALRPFSCGVVVDPAACTATCLRTGAVRPLRRVVEVIVEGVLAKQRPAGPLGGGGMRWLWRTVRLTPTGVYQLNPWHVRSKSHLSAVKKTVVTFAESAVAASVQQKSARGLPEGWTIVLRVAPRGAAAAGGGTAAAATAEIRMLASSSHDAQLWVHAINAAAVLWEQRRAAAAAATTTTAAAAAASTSTPAVSPPDAGAALVPSSLLLPGLPLAAHPEVALAAGLAGLARAAAAAEFRAAAERLASSPSKLAELGAAAVAAGPTDLTGRYYPVAAVLAALQPRGWAWADGRGEGPGAVTAAIAVHHGSPTYEARVLPLLEAAAPCEGVRRLAGLAGVAPHLAAHPRVEVVAAVRLQNQALGAAFAAGAAAAAAAGLPTALGVGFLPVTCSAEARRLAAYGASPSGDVPRLACTPAGAVEACAAAAGTALAARRAIRRRSAAADAPDAEAGGRPPSAWDGDAFATFCVAAVRVAPRAAAAAGADSGGTGALSLQDAVVAHGGPRGAVVATYVELLVWLRVVVPPAPAAAGGR
jgi:trimeric autotransporter adhesin